MGRVIGFILLRRATRLFFSLLVETKKARAVILKKQKIFGAVMANRHKDFDELLAAQFDDVKFAQAYIINLIDNEDMNLEEALRETIIAMGLQEFANKANLSIQYVSDFVNKRRRLSIETINKYFQSIFGLKTRIIVEAA